MSVEYLDSLWESQNELCALTGWPIQFGATGVEQTASLDRIDSSLGYTEGNVQFVHKDVNISKYEHRQDYFIAMCKAVVDYYENGDAA